MDAGAAAYRKFIDGDDEGMVELVTQYKDGLLLYLTGLVHDISLAEELTEDTFFKLLVKKPRYRESGSFKAWLYAIARNIARDEWRRRSHLTELSREQEGELQSLEQSYLSRQDQLTVRRCMKNLSETYQQVLWLKIFEEFSNAEIAKIMGKTCRQVEMLVYRAKQSLKAELTEEGFFDEDQ